MIKHAMVSRGPVRHIRTPTLLLAGLLIAGSLAAFSPASARHECGPADASRDPVALWLGGSDCYGAALSVPDSACFPIDERHVGPVYVLVSPCVEIVLVQAGPYTGCGAPDQEFQTLDLWIGGQGCYGANYEIPDSACLPPYVEEQEGPAYVFVSLCKETLILQP